MIASFFFFLASLPQDPAATHYFDATLFEKAAQAYQKESNRLKEIESLYFAEKYSAIIERLENQKPEGEEYYFLALAYQHLNQTPQALLSQKAYTEEVSVDVIKRQQVKESLNHHELNDLIDQKNWQAAQLLLASLPKSAENLYAHIQILEKLSAPLEEIKKARNALLTFSATSPFHAQIAFEMYSFQDYQWGEKEALNHLNHFVKEYKKSPYTLLAWYLLGLDRKKERKPDGKRRVHHKNLESAQDAFLEAENLYQEIKETLPQHEKAYWAKIRENAGLERARTLLEIAETSIGIKRHLYYVYTLDSLEILNQPEAKLLATQVYIKNKDLKSALSLVEKMQKGLSFDKEGLILAKFLLEKGRILAYMKHFNETLSLFDSIPSSIIEKTFSTEDSLSLKITKSLCHKELKQYDQAMLTLAEVINSEAISALRIKAMFIRSLIYQEIGKEKLAKRQYDAVMEKGGQWAAQEKSQWTKEYHLTLDITPETNQLSTHENSDG